MSTVSGSELNSARPEVLLHRRRRSDRRGPGRRRARRSTRRTRRPAAAAGCECGLTVVFGASANTTCSATPSPSRRRGAASTCFDPGQRRPGRRWSWPAAADAAASGRSTPSQSAITSPPLRSVTPSSTSRALPDSVFAVRPLSSHIRSNTVPAATRRRHQPGPHEHHQPTVTVGDLSDKLSHADEPCSPAATVSVTQAAVAGVVLAPPSATPTCRRDGRGPAISTVGTCRTGSDRAWAATATYGGGLSGRGDDRIQSCSACALTRCWPGDTRRAGPWQRSVRCFALLLCGPAVSVLRSARRRSDPRAGGEQARRVARCLVPPDSRLLDFGFGFFAARRRCGRRRVRLSCSRFSTRPPGGCSGCG